MSQASTSETQVDIERDDDNVISIMPTIKTAAANAGAALPNELPAPPDLSHLPAHVIHSATVETLIGQNDDLMARLKVNIRRNSVLEQQIMEQERTAGDLVRANASLMSQLQILQEKDQIWRDKSARNDRTQDTLKEEVDLLTTKLASAEERIDDLQAAEAYRRRVRRWVRPLLTALKTRLASEEKARLGKEAVISDLRAQLADTARLAKDIEARATRDQARLVEQYETMQSAIREQLEKRTAEGKLFREKAARMEEATAGKAAAENRIVSLERANQELQTGLEKFRRDSKTFETEATNLRGEVDDVKNALANSLVERDRLQDQFESLQAVWADAQKKLESAKLQHEALNRLNQELSRKLKDARKPSDPSVGAELSN